MGEKFKAGELFSVPIHDIKVVTECQAAASFVGHGEDLYPEPMVMLRVVWADVLSSLEEPLVSYFAVEPEHALSIGRSIAYAGLAGMQAAHDQKGRPNT